MATVDSSKIPVFPPLSKSEISKLLSTYFDWYVIYYPVEIMIEHDIPYSYPKYYWLVEKKNKKKKLFNRTDDLFKWQIELKHDGSYESLAKIIKEYDLLDYPIINLYSHNLLWHTREKDNSTFHKIPIDLTKDSFLLKKCYNIDNNFIKKERNKKTLKSYSPKFIHINLLNKNLVKIGNTKEEKPIYDTIGGLVNFSEMKYNNIKAGKTISCVRYFLEFLQKNNKFNPEEDTYAIYNCRTIYDYCAKKYILINLENWISECGKTIYSIEIKITKPHQSPKIYYINSDAIVPFFTLN